MSDLPSAKDLKRLADACRKAGIKAFKGHGIEFTLTDEAPVPSKRQKRNGGAINASNEVSSNDTDIETDGLTDDQLLFWSSLDLEDVKDASNA